MYNKQLTQETYKLVDAVLHRTDFHLQKEFENLGFPLPRIKAQKRACILDAVKSGRLSVEILRRIHELDLGWGNCSCFVFEILNADLEKYSDKDYLKIHLGKLDLLSSFDRAPSWNENGIAQTRLSLKDHCINLEKSTPTTWMMRVPDKDFVENNLPYKVWATVCSEIRTIAQIDFRNRRLIVLIPSLPSGSSYEKARDVLLQEISFYFPGLKLSPVNIAKAIPQLLTNHSYRKRKVKTTTTQGNSATFFTPKKGQDALRDPILNRGFMAMAEARQSFADFCSEKKSGIPSDKEIHFKIFGEEQRLSFLGEQTEKGVKNVIDTIVKYSKASH